MKFNPFKADAVLSALGMRSQSASDSRAPAIRHVSAGKTHHQGKIAVVDSGSPTISGQATAGSKVLIYDGKKLIGTAVADKNGSFHFKPDDALSDGIHRLSARSVDSDGHISSASVQHAIRVDRTAPSAPIFTTHNQAILVDRLPIAGKAEANAWVSIWDGDVLLGKVKANSSGHFKLIPPASLKAGPHTFFATATDLVGHVSLKSAPLTIRVRDEGPSAPTLSTKELLTGNATPEITGKAEAFAVISVYDGGTLLGTTRAGADGKFSFKPASPLTDGIHSIFVQAKDALGKVSPFSQVLKLHTDFLPPMSPVLGAISNESPSITGFAEPGSLVSLYDGNDLIGTVRASDQGLFSFTPGRLSVGLHTITARATDALGKISILSSAVTFNYAGLKSYESPVTPVATTKTDTAITDTTAPIATVTAATIANTGNAVVQSTETGTAYLVKSTLAVTNLASITSAPDSQWNSVAIGSANTNTNLSAAGLVDGTYKVYTVDAAGNLSLASTNAVTVDSTAPVYQSMAVHSNGGVAGAGTVVLTYDSPIDSAHLPAAGAFGITIGGVANPVTAVAASGNTVTLTLQNAVSAGAVTLTTGYTDPTVANDPNAIQDIAGNDAISFATTSGIVADGYIRGAQMYLDGPNGLQILNGVVTDENGNFFLPAGSNPNNYALVAVGGVNIDTGLPNVANLKAPAGATTINPLTTLVTAVMASTGATDAQAAATKVASALGLTGSLGSSSLLSFDPLSSTSAANTVIQKAAAQVATVIALAVSETNTSAAATTAASTVANNLATAIVNANTANTTLALADSSVLAQALSNVTVSTAIQSAIADAAFAISTATSVASISAVQSQYLDKIAPGAPVSLAVDAITNDTTPTVRVNLNVTSADGKAAVIGDKVALLVDGIETGATTLVASDITNGYVNVTSMTQTAGTHAVTARLIDQSGNTGTSATAVSTTIDIQGPTVSISASDGNLNLVFSEAVAGFTIGDISIPSGITLGSLSAPSTLSDGSVRYTVPYTAAVGSSGTISVNGYTDLAGNNGATSNSLNVANLTAPVVMIKTVGGADGVVSSQAGDRVVTGIGEPGLSVTLKSGGTTLGTASADANGAWTYTLTDNNLQTLGQGADSLTAEQTKTSSGGPVTGTSPAFSMAVDTVSPSTVTINPVATNDLINLAERKALGGVAITGSSEAGATISLTLATGLVKQVTADQSGAWTYTLTDADYKSIGSATSLSAVARDAAGNTSAIQTRTISIDTTAPALGQFALANESNTGLAALGITNDSTPSITFTTDATGVDVYVDKGAGYVRVAHDLVPIQGVVAHTFAASDINTSGSNNIKLVASDVAGNTTERTGTIKVDGVAPSLLITDDETGTGNIAGGNILYTFTFSEAVTGFTAADVLVANGVKGAFTSVSPSVYQLEVTPTVGFTGNVTVDVPVSVAQDAAGNNSLSAAQNVQPVDMLAPTVSSIVYGTNDGNLAVGESVSLTVTLSEAVNVTGVPTLALANGGTATYTGGSGTNSLTFSYTPASGQTTADLATAATNALTGTIKDPAGNAVVASGFNNVNPSGILAVDVTAPVQPQIQLAAASTKWTVAPQATIHTSLGDIVVELNPNAAPVTSANWLSYVNSDFYDNLIFHRVIDGFMVQGGGFTSSLSQVTPSYPAITLESNNGLSNLRGTIAMARTSVADSATDQFFINTVDNGFLNYTSTSNPGYAVFGQVISGLNVVDAISKVATNTTGGMQNVPVTPVKITSVDQTVAGVAYSQGTVNLVGLEAGAHWEYALDGGSSWVSYGSSALTVTSAEGSHTLAVRQVDAAGNVSAASSLSFVLDRTGPVFSSGSSANVLERQNLLYSAGASDQAGVATYSLSGFDAPLLSIAADGKVTLKTGNLDYEGGKTHYSFNVIATDSLGNSNPLAVVVNVGNVNEAPLITSAVTGSIAENAPTNTVVYTVVATDVDVGDTRIYSLTGADAGSFDINATTGVVTLKASANYEAKSTYSINVVATDAGGLTATQAVAVNVTNVNEAPIVAIPLVDQTFAVGAAGNSFIVPANTFTDVDANTTLTYSALQSDGTALPNWLTFNAATRTFSGNPSANGTVSVRVTANDGALSVYDDFVITAVTAPVAQSFTVLDAVNSNGASLGKSGEALTFVVTLSEPVSTLGTLTAHFSVNGQDVTATSAAVTNSKTITLTGATVPAGNGSAISLTSLASTAAITGVTTGQALVAPTAGAVTYAAYTVDNTAPTVSGISDGTSASVTKDSINFAVSFTEALTSDPTSSNFTATNGTVTSVSKVDSTHYTVVVTPNINVSSGTVGLSLVGGSLMDVVGNVVTNADLTSLDLQGIDTRAPLITSSATVSVAENTSPSSPIYTVVAEDINGASYSLIGTDASLFTIESDTGRVYFKVAPDYEAPKDFGGNNVYDFSVVATDSIGNTSQKQVALTVTNLVEGPELQSSLLDNVTNLDVMSDIVLNYNENVTAQPGKYIHIIDDGGLGFHGESTVNTLNLLVTGSEVTVSGGKVTINPLLDLDLSSNYHIVIDAGAFRGNLTHVDSLAFDGTTALNFQTVTPGTASLANAQLSVMMNAEGNLIDSRKWLDLENIGDPSVEQGQGLDLSIGNFALVSKDYDPSAGTNDFDGIAVNNFNVIANHFGNDDLIYIDNQSAAPNRLDQTSIVTDGTSTGTTTLQFYGTGISTGATNEGLGGFIDVTLVGTATNPTPTFESIQDMQSALGTNYPPVVSA